MRIELTVREPGDVHRDVAVVSPGPVELGAVIAGLTGRPPTTALWSGDRPLPSVARLGDDGLRTGAVLSVGGPYRTMPRPGVLALHQVGGRQAGRVVPVERGRLVIGRGPECDVVLHDPDVSRRHAVIEVTTTGITVADCASTNGTTVDGRPIDGVARPVQPGQRIRIGDSTLAVVGPADSPAALAVGDGGEVRVLRPPRRVVRVPDLEIEFPHRPTGARPRGVQWVTALLPALAGGAIAWFAHSPQFLLFALLSPVMMVGSALGDRLHWRRTRRRDAAAYRSRAAEADQAIAAALASEAEARQARSPDAAAVFRIAALPGSRLWERRPGDPDVLQVRLGVADIAAAVTVRRGTRVEPAGTMRDAPVDVGLCAGPLGVCGPAPMTDGVGRWLIGQLAGLHSPADLSLVMLLSPDRSESWQWARWLPHLAGPVADGPEGWANVVTTLQETLERRQSAHRIGGAGWSGRWTVVLIDRAARLAEVPGLADVLRRGREVGITAICLADDAEGLFTACRTVLAVRGVTGSRGTVRDELGVQHQEVVLDAVDTDWSEGLARALAPFTDAAADGGTAVPRSCRLLECLDADDIDADRLLTRWRSSDPSGRQAAAVIGLGVDGPLRVDLVTDGPHALVAGTTGAGKSELLQTLVAGLAVEHSPDDVNFLLIDYKGGAAFAECLQLPHTAGLVTDLDPYLTERALRSLNSELRRRETLFAAVGASDLTSYRATAREEQLARLVIVVDEFATLVEELPDFVRGLIGVAQRGRSLGIHLVLATQRPGSAVSPEIRANTSLRIALRVTDPGESSDVVGTSDAAIIERATPGRGYLRTSSSLVIFQTGYAGAPSIDTSQVSIEPLGPWRARAVAADDSVETELDRVVATARSAAALGNYRRARSPWLPALPDNVAVHEIDAPPGSVPFALVDLPDQQHQAPLTLTPGVGSSLLVAGTGRSGRTSALIAIGLGWADRYSSRDVHLYVVDAGGALSSVLSSLPHCATVLAPEDVGNVALLLRRLEQACARGTTTSGLLLIDGWETLTTRLSDVDALDCADLVAALLRAGPGAGLTTVVTGDRTVLTPRFSAGFAERILLRQSDRADFGLAGVSPRAVPNAMAPGRGVRTPDAAAVQFAHAGRSPDAGAARAEAERIGRQWALMRPVSDDGAVRLQRLPTQVPLDGIGAGDGLVLGLGGDSAEPLPFVAFDPIAGPARFLVAGPPRSGRSTVLCTLLEQAHDAGLACVVAATNRSPLSSLAREFGVLRLDPDRRGTDVPPAPAVPTLLLVDDCETFVDRPTGDALGDWLGAGDSAVAVVVAGRNDDLATTYRGIGAQVRRNNTGLLLRPGPVDGELLGVRLPRRPSSGPPGRGVVVGDPAWGGCYRDGDPQPIQVAQRRTDVVDQPMCG